VESKPLDEAISFVLLNRTFETEETLGLELEEEGLDVPAMLSNMAAPCAWEFGERLTNAEIHCCNPLTVVGMGGTGRRGSSGAVGISFPLGWY